MAEQTTTGETTTGDTTTGETTTGETTTGETTTGETTTGETTTEAMVAKWHQHLRGALPGGLDELLHDDVVFLSPIVFTPQRGKEITKLYLSAAGQTLGGDDGPVGAAAGRVDGSRGDPTGASIGGSSDGAPSTTSSGSFRYVKEVVAGNHAMLEFETSMGGTYVNGIDIITCDDDGKIVEFKVMIRPLQAINAVHEQMRAMLETLAPPPA